MTKSDLGRLLALAAIWGASFMFMRVLAPPLGPVVTAGLRVFIAGAVLLAYLAAIRYDMQWSRWGRHSLVIGVLNAAIPFACFAYAALHLPAGYSAILNATTPFFTALFAAWWLGDRLTWRKTGGLIIGALGVMLVVRVGQAQPDARFELAVGACLLAACCYGLSGIYLKKRLSGAPPLAVAAPSQLFAGLVLMPAMPFAPVQGPVTPLVIGNLLGLALLCSALASVLYYRLVANVGPSRAATVTFLIPVFAMAWARIFLGEPITLVMLLGCVLVIGGTWLLAHHPAPAVPAVAGTTPAR